MLTKPITIISSVLLATLPLLSIAEQCNETLWNESLKDQRFLDVEYNQYALKFNELLQFHADQPLLHKEFTHSEIQSFQSSQKTPLTQPLDKHIQATEHAIAYIDHQVRHLDDLKPQALSMQKRWLVISDACAQQQLIRNEVLSANYANSNQTLLLEIKELQDKFRLIQRRYRKEVESLQFD